MPMKPQMPTPTPQTVPFDPLTATDAEYQAHVDSKLANFGANAGKHGPLEAVTVRLPPLRVSRSAALNLANISRGIGLKGKTTPVSLMILEAFSGVQAADFLKTLAAIRR